MSPTAPEPMALFTPAMLPDPYPTYRHLRETDPVHWHPPLGAWVLTRYDDVDAALRDGRLSSTLGDVIPTGAGGAGGWEALRALYTFVANSLVFSDPPRHTRLRELVARAFTPRSIEVLRPRIQALTDAMLDGAVARGRLELVQDLAYPLPIAVIASVLGSPVEDARELKRWCDHVLLPFGRDPGTLTPAERAQAADGSARLAGYARARVAETRARPGDSLLATLVERATGLLSVGTLALLQHPEQLAALRADPALLPAAVEELTRYTTPNQFIRRRALHDVPLGGRVIRAGQFVLLVLAAANRDPAHFPDPDRLDVRRPPGHHLAFGHGMHYCLGVALARLEAEVVFGALARRFPGLRLTSRHVAYVDNFNVRQLQALPLAW